MLITNRRFIRTFYQKVFPLHAWVLILTLFVFDIEWIVCWKIYNNCTEQTTSMCQCVFYFFFLHSHIAFNVWSVIPSIVFAIATNTKQIIEKAKIQRHTSETFLAENIATKKFQQSKHKLSELVICFLNVQSRTSRDFAFPSDFVN